MRPLMIVVCLLLLSPAPALGCYEHTTEATTDLATGHRAYIEEVAEASSMMSVRMAGAGLAAVGLIVVVARALPREPATRRIRLVEPWARLDAGHDRPRFTGHVAGIPGALIRLVDRRGARGDNAPKLNTNQTR